MPNQLYRNDAQADNWIRIELEGTASNRSAIGTRIVVDAVVDGSTVRQTRVVQARTSWRSADSHVQHFGLGDAEAIETVEVRWPSGRVDRLAGPLEVNRTMRLTEGG